MISKLIKSQLTSSVCLKFKNLFQSTLYCEVAITFLTEIILLLQSVISDFYYKTAIYSL